MWGNKKIHGTHHQVIPRVPRSSTTLPAFFPPFQGLLMFLLYVVSTVSMYVVGRIGKWTSTHFTQNQKSGLLHLHLWKNSFAGYTILSWQLDFFQHFEYIAPPSSGFHCFWWEMSHSSLTVALDVIRCFSLAAFQISSLSFNSVTLIYLGVFLLVSVLVEVHWISWICR